MHTRKTKIPVRQNAPTIKVDIGIIISVIRPKRPILSDGSFFVLELRRAAALRSASLNQARGAYPPLSRSPHAALNPGRV